MIGWMNDMDVFIVEHIFYKKTFLVYALSDTGAKIRVSEYLKQKNINVRITELEAVRVKTFMSGQTVKEI